MTSYHSQVCENKSHQELKRDFYIHQVFCLCLKVLYFIPGLLKLFVNISWSSEGLSHFSCCFCGSDVCFMGCFSKQAFNGIRSKNHLRSRKSKIHSAATHNGVSMQIRNCKCITFLSFHYSLAWIKMNGVPWPPAFKSGCLKCGSRFKHTQKWSNFRSCVNIKYLQLVSIGLTSA